MIKIRGVMPLDVGAEKSKCQNFSAAFVIKIGKTNVKLNEVDQIGI